MADIFNALNNDIMPNGQLSWKGLLFTLSEPAAFIGIYIAYKHAKECLSNPQLFDKSNLNLAFFLALAFSLRIPYMWNKPLARVLLFLNAGGWIYVTILYFMVSIKKI